MSTLIATAIQNKTGLDLTSKYIKVGDTGDVSAVSSVTIDGCFTTNYDVYKVYFTGVNAGGPTGNSCVSNFRLRQGAADWAGSVTQRKYRDYSGHTTAEIDLTNAADGIVNTGPYNRMDRGTSLEMTIHRPAHSNFSTFWDFRQIGFHPGNDYTFPNNARGGTIAQTAHTGIRYYMTVESWTTCRMTVYGLFR
jgi:hypothetical protein